RHARPSPAAIRRWRRRRPRLPAPARRTRPDPGPHRLRWPLFQQACSLRQFCLQWQPMQPRTVGGYEWQSAQKVTEYLDREKEPERESEFTEAHQQMLDMLPVEPD